MTVRLYVGNLPKEPIERETLQAVFDGAGEIVSTKVIKDRKTGKCRGFAFVTVPTDEIADVLIEQCNGQSFMDSPLKIEKALPREKGKEEDSEFEAATTATATPTPTAAAPTKATAKKGGKKRGGRAQSSTSSAPTESFQPDPRWADELAKLRDMLAAAQTT
jgi:RNA recognition motif-containing protein